MSVRVFLKLFVLGGLSLALLIALAAIGGVVQERRMLQAGVEREIAESYAGEQQILGPLLIVEVEDRWLEAERISGSQAMREVERSEMRRVTLFPEVLEVETAAEVEELSRGIFKARVFQSVSEIRGDFYLPGEADLLQSDGRETRFVRANVVLGIEDIRGLSSVPRFALGGEPVSWASGTGMGLPGIHAPVDWVPGATSVKASFELDLEVHGMGALFVTPVGAENRIRLRSAWPHPSFTGNFLPSGRSVSAEGFEAEWRVNGLASNVRQQVEGATGLARLQRLGVRFIDPITPYPLTNRAVKYGFLFIGITFISFFLYEIIAGLRIHPIQYSFVGFAQALFFLLLLGLSEHIRFGAAYAVAMAGTCGLLGVYVAAILQSRARGITFGGGMVFLYGAMWGLLQSEDHALVAGSVLLFVLLGALMWLTRKVDWYALTSSAQPPTRKPDLSP